MKKSIYALFLCFVCIFCFCGCAKREEVNVAEQNAFRIIRKAEPTGEIALTYIFPVNSKVLEELEFDQSDVATYKFYLATYVTALSKQYEQRAKDGVYFSGCTYFTDVDGLGFTMTFEDTDAQKQFFDAPQQEENKSDVKTSGFFMKRTEIAVNFPVSSKESADNFKMLCQMAITSWCKDNQIQKQDQVLSALDNSVFIYDFVSSEKGLKSDFMRSDGSAYHNIFIKTQKEIAQGSKIVFFSTAPNVPVWYVLALLVVLVAMLVAWLVLRRKHVKKHENE